MLMLPAVSGSLNRLAFHAPLLLEPPVDSILSTAAKTLKKGHDVTIPGFGKFSVAHRGPRTGRNPATGAPLKIKASKAPKFTAGASLKATVSGKKS